MARISYFSLIIPFLLLLMMITPTISTATAINQQQPTENINKARSRAFIEEQCRATHYFEPCVRYLSVFASSSSSAAQTPEQLAQVALRVSLVRARFARQYISKVAKDLAKKKKSKDYQAVRDCLEQISDIVDQLTNSVWELGKMSLASETDFFWHQSNINSWVSAAQTDALTCLNGFSGHAAVWGRVKATIRAKVMNVVEVTSNALAFINRYVARHQVKP